MSKGWVESGMGGSLPGGKLLGEVGMGPGRFGNANGRV